MKIQSIYIDRGNARYSFAGHIAQLTLACWCSLVSLQAKVSVAEQTEKDIDATRLEYVPVAVRTQILFFCVSDLSNVDPMYQYSLEWFLNIFLAGIGNSEQAGTSAGPPGGAQIGRHLRLTSSLPPVCVFQTRWSRGSRTSTSTSPSACTATCAAACLRSTSSCSPSCCALAS